MKFLIGLIFLSPQVLTAFTQAPSFDSASLLLNGTAIHRRFIFDIYELSLYMKYPSHDPSVIMKSTELKHVKLKFLRNLKSEIVRNAFRNSFNENCADDCLQIQAQMVQLLIHIPDMPKGSLIDFLLYSDHSEITAANGEVMDFEGPLMGKYFLNSWLGDSPPSERFKRELLGLGKKVND